jgi:glutamyl-tRNA reductase|tara:strand:+ start:1738 stop:2805 length:1068 start_codon:yes stop_codon:yes gene_type:complete
MSSERHELLVVTVNHETVPIEERERYSLDETQVEALYKTLHDNSIIEESLILNTCNRFELYFKTNEAQNGKTIVFETLSSFYGIPLEELEAHAKTRGGQDAIKHLIEVSAGLRSQITGEAEIFGQVKNAYSKCQQFGGAGALINRMVQKGFQAAKLIRHSTPIGVGQINISNVAVDLSLKIFGSLDNTSALIIGTGEISEKTAKALRSRGAQDFGIASHSANRAESVAHDWGGKPHTIGALDSYLNNYDILISSTNAEEPLVTKALLDRLHPSRKNRPLFLIDLGLPRNVEPTCQELDNVYLYNLDDLAKIAQDNLSDRQAAIHTSEKIASQKSDAIWQMLGKRGLVSCQQFENR